MDVDEVLDVVTTGQADKLGPLLRNLAAQGVAPVTLCIGAMRHFRRLHSVASDPGGPAAGAGRLRPPVFGPRRDKIVRQAGGWGRDRLERALTVLSGHVKQQAAEIERLRAELGNRAGPDHPEQEDAKQDAIDDERHKAHAFDESHKKRNRRERRKKS